MICMCGRFTRKGRKTCGRKACLSLYSSVERRRYYIRHPEVKLAIVAKGKAWRERVSEA